MIYADTSALVKRYLDEPFSGEFSVLRVGEIDAAHFTSAYHLIGRLADVPLRTLDALHLAAAEQMSATAFATADKYQAEAAAALGFAVHRFY